MYEVLVPAVQIFVALGLINVWLVRPNLKTRYRGGTSATLREEFSSYGLPSWAYYLIGFLKLTCAILLLVGLWFRPLVVPTALIMTFFMLGAVLMHAKIKDPLSKALPAFGMLVLNLGLFISFVGDGI